MIDLIQTDNAPIAAGHYSQAVKANGFVFTAITLPIDPQNPKKEKMTIKDQAAQVLDNIFEIINAANSSIEHIVKITIYVSSVDFWDDINDVYIKKLGSHKPARGVIETSNIRKGYDIAMEAVAIAND